MPSRDGDEGNSLGVVADLLDEVGSFLDDFVETILGPLNDIEATMSETTTKGRKSSERTLVVSILLTATMS